MFPRAAFLALITLACAGDRPPPKGDVCTRCGACEEHRPVTSAGHLLGTIEYPDPPPTGGDHNPCWATWGVHTDAVPAERWVHNLEHGGVVFLYRSDDGGTLAPDDETALTDLVNRLPRTLLTAYTGPLQGRFAVIAWGYRLVSDCLDLEADQKFYDEHFDRAPEDIPDDPSCN